MTLRATIVGVAMGLVPAIPPVAAFAQLVTRPATAPVEKIVEIRLEDPVSGESKSYFDLDAGKTFTRAEATPEDYLKSRRWIREQGIDLMCESREPSRGLIAYDMVVREAQGSIDERRDYAVVRQSFEHTEAQPFDMLSAGAKLPKTYLFRTSDSKLGVLEISAIVEEPAGVRLRYRLLEPPPPPGPGSILLAGGQLIAIPQVTTNAMRVKALENNLQAFQRANLENSAPALRTRQRLDYYQKLAIIKATETDRELAGLKRSIAESESIIVMLKATPRPDAATIGSLERQVTRLTDEIKQRAAATQPAAGAPTTQATGPTTAPIQ